MEDGLAMTRDGCLSQMSPGWGFLGFVAAFGLPFHVVAQAAGVGADPAAVVVDTVAGTVVPDPFRALEDLTSAATKGWVLEQSRRFRAAIDNDRTGEVAERLEGLRRFTRFGVPERRGDTYYVSRGSEGGAIVLTFRDLDEPALDTVRLASVLESETDAIGPYRWYSPDGRYLVFGVDRNRSRWQELVIYDSRQRRFLEDRLSGFYFERGSIAWENDGAGFYYTRYYGPPGGEEQDFAVEARGIFHHSIGSAQTMDRRVELGDIEPSWVLTPSITTDGAFLVVVEREGAMVGVSVVPLGERDGTVRRLLTGTPAIYHYAGSRGRELYLHTDLDAPGGRVISVDLGPEGGGVSEIVPEEDRDLSEVTQVGSALALKYVEAGATYVRVVRADSTEYDLELPSAGWLWGLQHNPLETETFFLFGTLFDPGTIYRVDVTHGDLDVVARPDLPFDAVDFEVRQVSYSSTQGTEVPMYVAHRRGLSMDGRRPTWVSGYGAFGAVAAPFYRAEVVEWMREGGVFAMPGIRGGGEYGAAWHAAGSRANKQNGIDDFVAAAEWLLEEGYTAPEYLVAEGWSAGAVVAGAAIVQRPDLFRAALLSNPTLDQLRYHLFGAGAGWISEYGSPNDPDEARALLAYSPYHNLRSGTCYPAVLVTVGELDDTAVPSHGYKFVAAAQAAQGCDRPILLKVAKGAGHALGATRAQTTETTAQHMVFVRSQLGNRRR